MPAAHGGLDKKRLNIVLPERSAQRLDALKEKTEAATYTEVLKDALRLYEALIEEAENGNEFCIREKDGRITSYRLFR